MQIRPVGLSSELGIPLKAVEVAMQQLGIKRGNMDYLEPKEELLLRECLKMVRRNKIRGVGDNIYDMKPAAGALHYDGDSCDDNQSDFTSEDLKNVSQAALNVIKIISLFV